MTVCGFAVLAEVLRRRLAPLGTKPVLAPSPDLGVGVDVDRDDSVEVDASSQLEPDRP